MAEEINDLPAQRKFLEAIDPELLKYKDNVIWLVKNILAGLPQASRQLLKVKYGLAGGYTDYSDRELASIFKKKDVAELQTAVRRAMTQARALSMQLRKRLS